MVRFYLLHIIYIQPNLSAIKPFTCRRTDVNSPRFIIHCNKPYKKMKSILIFAIKVSVVQQVKNNLNDYYDVP